jgi:hypothetical protein
MIRHYINICEKMFTLRHIMQRQTYQNLKRHCAQFQLAVGLSLSCLDEFFLYFEVQWDKCYRRFAIAGKERIRPPRTCKNKVLENTQSMLVFILHDKPGAFGNRKIVIVFRLSKDVKNDFIPTF